MNIISLLQNYPSVGVTKMSGQSSAFIIEKRTGHKCYLDINGNVKMRFTEDAVIIQNSPVMYESIGLGLTDVEKDLVYEDGEQIMPPETFSWKKLPFGAIPITKNKIYLGSLDIKGVEWFWILQRRDETIYDRELEYILNYLTKVCDLMSLTQENKDSGLKDLSKFLTDNYLQ